MTWDERIERMRSDLRAIADKHPEDEVQDVAESVKEAIEMLEETLEGM